MSPVPRVSTRGYYDLKTGNTIKRRRYHLYPKRYFDSLEGSEELAVMIHGLRNDNYGAVAKTVAARDRLAELGYGHPVVGFSYDSNTTGAHLIRHARHALRVGERIARKNGRNLGLFITDFKEKSPDTMIRLMGHSLGSLVILSTVEYLHKKNMHHILESVHLFGASISADVPCSEHEMFADVVRDVVVNHYAPSDEVLGWADSNGYVDAPLGLNGIPCGLPEGFIQRLVVPQNHRFASYAAVLESFP